MGWNQGLYEQSATKKETLGALRFTADGRSFRYARASGALVAGKACIMAPAIANHVKQANTGYTMAVGDTCVTVLVGATAVTANQYDDGYLQIYDGAAGAVGQQMMISSHGVSAAGSEGVSLNLAEPVRAAVIATDSFALIPNPWSVASQTTALANGFAGIAVIPVTTLYYCWLQTGGVGCALNQGATPLGTSINMSATAGALETSAGYTSPFVGNAIGFASITAKYNPIFLGHY
jgi:hypothetical protein